MSASLNRVIFIGNLTRDPETRKAGSATVCTLRLAVSDRVKNRDSGAWEDHANYFTLSVFGTQAERCAQHLAKGRQAAVDGRLRWRSWESNGGKREAVEVVAEHVQFIGASEHAPARVPGTASASASPDGDIPF